MHATHWYIDIDGTLTTAQMREYRAFSTGVAVGSYGTPERHYPHGKEAFYAVFGDPDLFHTDQTMEGAEELIHRLKPAFWFNPTYDSHGTSRASCRGNTS